MLAGEAPQHQGPGNACSVSWEIVDDNDPPLLGHDLSCGSAEQLHWFYIQCIAQLHACPLCRLPHPLCTAPPPRETQTNDLTLHTLRTLIARNVWARDRGDSPDVEWLDVLGEADPAAPPPRPPWGAPTWALPDEQTDPTIWVPDYEYYSGMQRGSPPELAICRTVGAPSAP